MTDTPTDPITDYDILERALGKLTMASPNEHARGVAALHRIRGREMDGQHAAPFAPGEAERVVELEDRVDRLVAEAEQLFASVAELKQLDEDATRQLLELRAERAYTDEVIRQLRPQLEAQEQALLPDWESMTAEYQDLWREAARDEE